MVFGGYQRYFIIVDDEQVIQINRQAVEFLLRYRLHFIFPQKIIHTTGGAYKSVLLKNGVVFFNKAVEHFYNTATAYARNNYHFFLTAQCFKLIERFCFGAAGASNRINKKDKICLFQFIQVNFGAKSIKKEKLIFKTSY
jgi:hypothetical protein